jgi:N,N'-diacetyllegionaminate synthase
MHKVIIIAEAGVNHNGDVNLAKQLIDAAADAGVDYIKFQTWITEELMDKDAPKAEYQKQNDGSETSQYEMAKKLELSFDDFRELKKYSDKIGVKFLSTPDEAKSLDFLSNELKLPILKVGSGEVSNIPFLRQIGSKKREVILSTGMATIGEVEKAYYTLLQSGAVSVSLLHCTSNYPASYDSVNLKAMLTLQVAFNTTVGYSDHTMGNEVSLAAVALGAKIIEKHFTLDVNLPGPDHKASITPNELKQLVLQIRNVEKALLGSGTKTPHLSEIETKKVVSKGIYLNQNMKAGSVITDESIVMKRPSGEINSNMYDVIIGKKINKDLIKGEALKLDHLSFS